jgi:hypothetical protein
MPVGILQSLPGQAVHIFVSGFIDDVRDGYSACLTPFSHFYVVEADLIIIFLLPMMALN